MTIPALSPLNDLAFVATIKVANSAGALVPLEAGTPTAFLAVTDTPTAVAADGSLTTVPTYTGAGGKWLVAFDASVLSPALMASLFAAATPYVIVQFPNSIRIAIECVYTPTKTVQPA